MDTHATTRTTTCTPPSTSFADTAVAVGSTGRSVLCVTEGLPSTENTTELGPNRPFGLAHEYAADVEKICGPTL